MQVEVQDAEGQRVLSGLLLGRRYLLVRPLASESRWIARHTTLDIEVVVELMSGELAKDPAARRRFEQEARLLAALRSAHVVTVHDHGADGEVPYLVTERLSGEDLARRLSRDKRLSLADVRRLLPQLAKGLGRAHEAGLCHLALDPSCIFLAQIDGEETVKIVGFGGAGRVGEGARSYLSPEQVRGAHGVDLRADLWALAAILYRALTGVLPFPAEDRDARAAQVLGDHIVPPTETAPGLPRALDGFFARALARDPDARFPSARELCAAFEAAAAGASRMPRAAVSAIEVARQELARKREEHRPAPPPKKKPLAVATQRRLAAALGALAGAAITFAIVSALRGAPPSPAPAASASAPAPARSAR